ncbi:hypothetical protein [Streptomyces sp. WAC07061]|uniref:hypothetical protein n=1 Tax=Streptomyces sp. WAC07061 TaxID=2487410 RepID=UPI00163BB362|nr:hypothetical protein [Streptomyces sp. WAC07061]
MTNSRNKALLLALSAAAAATALTAATLPAQAAPAPRAEAPALGWHPCAKPGGPATQECADLPVPLDYDDPAGPQVSPLPLDRVYLLNPGQSLSVGDRTLRAFRPPLFDNPATVGFFDDRTGTCYSSDCFGAPLPTADLATCPDVAEVDAEDLKAAQLLWASVDSPWAQNVDPARFLATADPLRSAGPGTVLSTHLPPATGLTPRLLDTLTAVPGLTPYTGPDQAALEQMLATFAPGPH